MDFRRSGLHNDRRRRIVKDVMQEDNSAAGKQAKPRQRLGQGLAVRRSSNYGDAEFLDEQPRLLDLIPTRLLSFVVIFICGTAMVAAVEVLYYWSCALLLPVRPRRGFPPWIWSVRIVSRFGSDRFWRSGLASWLSLSTPCGDSKLTITADVIAFGVGSQ